MFAPGRSRRPRGAGSRIAGVAPEPGRVVAVWGPPRCGASLLADSVAGAAQRAAVVRASFDADLDAAVRSASADLVILDMPMTPDRVQYLWDRRLVYPGSGALVRVIASERDCRERGAHPEAVNLWWRELPKVEARIRELSMPYFCVHHEPGEDGAVQAAFALARRAGLQA